jgi:DNA-binding NarL/FixJ family response regulator
MHNPAIIQVAIVDDHGLFRNGMIALLKEYDDIAFVVEAANGEELIKRMDAKNLPDVILMDINMPKMDGLATTIWLQKNYPQVLILTLSMFDDEQSVIKMLRAGASGYILKESEVSEVHKAIRSIVEKGFYTNDMVSGRMIKSFHQQDDTNDIKANLTQKEMQFLQLCATEMTYKEMADKLDVAVRSVDNYSRSLFEKTNTKSRVGLVMWAIRNKIIEKP